MRRAPGSLWYRAHLRQALVLGIVVTVALFALLAIPLIVMFVVGFPNAVDTIRIYAAFMLLDVLAFIGTGVLLIGCAVRASRGETFRIPVVTALGERLFVRGPR